MATGAVIARIMSQYSDKGSKAAQKDIKKLGNWVTSQKSNYTENKQIMCNPEIRKEWEDTIDKYKEYLVIDNEEQWRLNLKKLVDYMEKEKKSPKTSNKNPDIKKLSYWISTNKKNYLKKQCIMTNPEIRKKWKETVDKYPESFFATLLRAMNTFEVPENEDAFSNVDFSDDRLIRTPFFYNIIRYYIAQYIEESPNKIRLVQNS